MIVKSHSRQVGEDMLAFEPPFQKVVILNVFRPGGQIPRKLIDCGFASCMECREGVENVSRQHSLTHAFWLRRKGYLISKTVRAVKLVTDDVFCCRDPSRSPASMLEVRKLVARV